VEEVDLLSSWLERVITSSRGNCISFMLSDITEDRSMQARIRALLVEVGVRHESKGKRGVVWTICREDELWRAVEEGRAREYIMSRLGR